MDEPLLPSADDEDVLYDQVFLLVVRERKCTASYLQRQFRVSFLRAAGWVKRLQHEGIVSAVDETGHREILLPLRRH